MRSLRLALDELYEQYNRREFVHPDPLEFLYEYDNPRDREIVALLAASLAYGRVAQILRSVRTILDLLRPAPFTFLERTPPRDYPEIFAGFKHRWTTGPEVAALLAGARRAIEHFGSLGRCFAAGLHPDDDTVLPALAKFVDHLRPAAPGPRNSLLPIVPGNIKPPSSPIQPSFTPGSSGPNTFSGAVGGTHPVSELPQPSPLLSASQPSSGATYGTGSACKRLHLMLRWLVRRDAVDPGGWDVPPRLLVIPLDTHMHQVGTALGLCTRSQADCRTALAITDAFRSLQPDDPVHYDFSLTRLGIRAELDLPAFLARCRR